MQVYNVHVEARITGQVEVEAETEDEARDIAEGMDTSEWDEQSYDTIEITDVEVMGDLCDHCRDYVESCTCDPDEEEEEEEDDE